MSTTVGNSDRARSRRASTARVNERSRATIPIAPNATATRSAATGEMVRPLTVSATVNATPPTKPPTPQVACSARNPDGVSFEPAAARRAGRSRPSSPNRRCNRAPRSSSKVRTRPRPRVAASLRSRAGASGGGRARRGTARAAARATAGGTAAGGRSTSWLRTDRFPPRRPRAGRSSGPLEHRRVEADEHPGFFGKAPDRHHQPVAEQRGRGTAASTTSPVTESRRGHPEAGWRRARAPATAPPPPHERRRGSRTGGRRSLADREVLTEEPAEGSQHLARSGRRHRRDHQRRDNTVHGGLGERGAEPLRRARRNHQRPDGRRQRPETATAAAPDPVPPPGPPRSAGGIRARAAPASSSIASGQTARSPARLSPTSGRTRRARRPRAEPDERHRRRPDQDHHDAADASPKPRHAAVELSR